MAIRAAQSSETKNVKRSREVSGIGDVSSKCTARSVALVYLHAYTKRISRFSKSKFSFNVSKSAFITIIPTREAEISCDSTTIK